MSRSRFTDAICIVLTVVMVLVTSGFMWAAGSGTIAQAAALGYVDELFGTNRVHTIDIVVDESDWQDMLASATSEEYIVVDVVIDSTTVPGIGLRPKGNSSLSSIATSDSDRYSFKVEFDHYVTGRNYLGLDKLALNNIAQDNTYMKDYVTYRMMAYMNAEAPLCSFIWVTVNGEDWGLYLAVEAIEDSFAQRSYGSTDGQIYKPDSMDMGDRGMGAGARGAGGAGAAGGEMPAFEGGEMPAFEEGGFPIPQEGEIPMPGGDAPGGDAGAAMPGGDADAVMPGGGGMAMPEGAPDLENMPDDADGFGGGARGFGGGAGGGAGGFGGDAGGFGGFGGTGATTLSYIDDSINSYSTIFDSAITTPTSSDKNTLIAAIKDLNEGEIESSVSTDEVINYFVVHNFVLNSDSYTGSLVHNYYLHEQDGKLSMIAWDYNLAFGGMGNMGMDAGMGAGMGGLSNRGAATANDNATIAGDTPVADDTAITPADSATYADITADTGSVPAVNSATTLVNYPLDSPLLSGSMEERPMLSWIFADEEYLSQYHERYGDFIEGYFESGLFSEEYDATIALISPCVQNDPTSFCAYDDFLAASTNLKEFCLLRAESLSGQLDGSIPATSETQTADNSSLLDASAIDVSAMGSNEMGFGRARNLRE